MSKIVLFNGPRLSGKNYAMDHLASVGIKLFEAECKGHLHNLVMMLYCIPQVRYWEIYNDRSLKETPLPEFRTDLYLDDDYYLSESLKYQIIPDDANVSEWELRYKDTPEDAVVHLLNLSIREAMIYVSEVISKPRFGDDYFGKARISSIKTAEAVGVKWFVDSSTGFPEELPPLIDYLGQENILLLRIHRDGYTFDGDSRSYIPDGVIDNTVDIDNNGSEEEYFSKVESIVRGFLNEDSL